MSKPTTASERMPPVYSPTILIILMCLLGTLVSFAWLLQSPVNYQEKFNLTFATNSHLNPLYQGSHDNPMPFYYWFIHLTAKVITPSIFSLRLVSLACYWLLLPAVYWAGNLATGNKRSGLLGALFVAISPFMLLYASRGTMYALLTLVTVLNQVCFLLILRKNHWGWPFYLITGLLGLSVHYIFAVVLLMQFIFFVIKRRDFSRVSKVLMMLGATLFAVSFGVWIRHLDSTVRIFKFLPYSAKPSATNAFIIFAQFLFGFQTVTTTTLIIAFWPLLVLLALLAVQKYVKPSIGIQYFSFASFIAVLFVFALSWAWRSLFLSSYLIICLPAFMLFIGWYLVAFELNILEVARTVLIALMLSMLVLQLFHIDSAVREDYLGAVNRQNVNWYARV